jgi:hypothetical protein
MIVYEQLIFITFIFNKVRVVELGGRLKIRAVIGQHGS